MSREPTQISSMYVQQEEMNDWNVKSCLCTLTSDSFDNEKNRNIRSPFQNSKAFVLIYS